MVVGVDMDDESVFPFRSINALVWATFHSDRLLFAVLLADGRLD
jgi:hypothetical protein